MTKLVWDSPLERRYESGLDRGVLFLQDGTGVTWNGLIQVDEKSSAQITPLYWDGKKYNDLVVPGDYAATLRAFTYPDEFAMLEGIDEIEKGMFVTNQPPQRFHLCYRTHVGNPVEGQYADYKIHVVYNCLAKPSSKSFQSVSDDPSASEFQWDISAVPQSVDGFVASSHLVFDTRFMDPLLLGDIERILYGGDDTDPELPTMQGFSSYIRKWARIIIQDNGDGTWTAIAAQDDQIVDNMDGTFTMPEANATLAGVTYTIDSTDPETGDI